ncbi:MAG TPA: tetratricopeptide repeat protein [Gammaproteobacteria bacterium]|nr:tetratricopeptide repeat protein [Gammaproteobacteria bacterium]
MDRYVAEDEQVEALKAWWKENGKAIIAGVIFGLLGLMGWRYWQGSIKVQAEQASTAFQQLLSQVADNKKEAAEQQAKQILDQYEKSPYAAFAALMLAKIAVDKNDLAQAKTHLQWALAHSTEPEIKRVARLRLVRLLLAEGNTDQAQSLLDEKDNMASLPSYHELKGDLLLAQGKLEEARNAYLQALALGGTTGEQSSVVQMKLDELGEASPAPKQAP